MNEHGEFCLGAISALNTEGIGVNTTAILSINQAVLAAKAGATFVSIFAGRVADEGNDPAVVIGNVRRWLDDWEYPAEIIVGSIGTVMDIQNAALAGAHLITIPPQFLPKMGESTRRAPCARVGPRGCPWLPRMETLSRYELGGRWCLGGDPAVLRLIRSLALVKSHPFGRRIGGALMAYPFHNHRLSEIGIQSDDSNPSGMGGRRSNSLHQSLPLAGSSNSTQNSLPEVGDN